MSGLADELSVGQQILIILGHFRDDMPPEAVRELQEIAALRQPAPDAAHKDARAVMNPQSGGVSSINTGQVYNVSTHAAPDAGDALGQIAAMMGKHVENWPVPKRIKTAIALIDKTIAASRDHNKRMKDALEQSLQGWENVVELGLIPERYMDGAVKLAKVCRTALEEKS